MKIIANFTVLLITVWTVILYFIEKVFKYASFCPCHYILFKEQIYIHSQFQDFYNSSKIVDSNEQ